MTAGAVSRVVGRAGLIALLVLNVALLARSLNEDDRIRAELDGERIADCRGWLGEAGADLAASSTDLARVIVRNAAAQYESRKCTSRTGPLPPVDPEAYRTAPAPPR